MKQRFFLLAAFLVVAYLGGRYLFEGRPEIAPSQEVEKASGSSKPKPSRTYTPPVLESRDHGSETAKDDFAPPDGLAKQNELLLTFSDPAAYQRFLDSLRAAGDKVIGRIDALSAARVRIDSAEDARRVKNLAGDEASSDYNYIVAAPTLPESPTSGGYAIPFDNQALNWLGVPEDHREWGKGVMIALLDTGVSEHASLDDLPIERKSLVESSDNPESDYNGHGTAIASLLVGKDGMGIAPAAEVISIQVMDSEGIGDSFTLAAGIMEAVDSGASVVSMSLGSYGYTSVLENAVNYALSQEVALVASIGNDGANVAPYPAQFQGVIGVTAVDKESQRAAFSNYSPAVDIAAPGVGVFAAWGDEKWISFSGTSAATPYVSGSIAATMSLNPELSPNQAADLLLNYADDGGAPGLDVEFGSGTLNLDRVIKRDEPNIYDAAVGDFYLDLDQATDTTIPLRVTVQNRGTERLNSVSVAVTQNDGIPQKVYLGSLVENETTTHTIYLDKAQLDPETGYSISAETIIAGRDDSRSSNDAKSGTLRIPNESP